MPIGDFGFEQFAQQVLVGPTVIAGAPAQSGSGIVAYHRRQLEFALARDP